MGLNIEAKSIVTGQTTNSNDFDMPSPPEAPTGCFLMGGEGGAEPH